MHMHNSYVKAKKKKQFKIKIENILVTFIGDMLILLLFNDFYWKIKVNLIYLNIK